MHDNGLRCRTMTCLDQYSSLQYFENRLQDTKRCAYKSWTSLTAVRFWIRVGGCEVHRVPHGLMLALVSLLFQAISYMQEQLPRPSNCKASRDGRRERLLFCKLGRPSLAPRPWSRSCSHKQLTMTSKAAVSFSFVPRRGVIYVRLDSTTQVQCQP